MNRDKYRELFRLRAIGELPPMECTKSCYETLASFLVPDSCYSDAGTYNSFHFLDIPCGAGHYYKVLQNLKGVFQYHGIDKDIGMVNIAKDVWNGHKNVSFSVGDVHSLSFPDDSFGIVLCYNLLLHLDSFKKPLSELYRVLKPDGCLLIRSLFGDVEKIVSIDGTPYNTFSRNDVSLFIKSLPKQSGCWFYPDQSIITKRMVKKQSKKVGVDSSEFTQDHRLKGVDLNYELLVVDKWRYKYEEM